MFNIKKGILAFTIIGALILSSCPTVWAAVQGDQVSEGINKAVEYLHTVQNNDGGFPYREGQASSQSVTCWVIMALAEAGEDLYADEWSPAGSSPIDFLNHCEEELYNTCDYARTLLALTSAKQGTVYQGEDLLESLLALQQEDGQFASISRGEEGFINSHIWAILALDSAGRQIPDKDKARQWLINHQNEDGGFGWGEAIPSDSDDTAAALQVLYLLGEDPADSEAVKNGLAYLKTCQEEDGGFSSGFLAGHESNAGSNAWVIQALLALGEDPTEQEWSINDKHAVAHLLQLQDQSGFFNYMQGIKSGPIQTTATSLLALCPALRFIEQKQDSQILKSPTFIEFSDLSENHWAYQQISELLKAEVLTGYPDGTFKPEKQVNRAEFAVMMVKGLGLENDINSLDTGFSDIPENYWAAGYISICVNRGYVKGLPGGIYGPQNSITGAELAAMLVRSLPVEVPETAGACWYEQVVSIAEQNDLLYPGFQPETAVNRAQCAYSVMRLRGILDIN